MSPSPSPLPVVLVGCGAVSRLFYAPALRALEQHGLLRVAALADPSAPARAQLQSSFPAAHACASLEAADLPAGALAIIASPPRWHEAHVLAALARGWHVLCEKPMAANTAEAARMIAAADAAGRLLAIGHYKRFFPSSLALKQLCGAAGALGPLQSFSIAEGGPFNWPAASPSFFKKDETPGGVLLDIGVHVFDLLLWWLGEPDAVAYADDAMGGLEANARVTLQFGPVTGRVRLSRDWATEQRYDFVFAHGTAAWTVNDANGLALTLDGAPFALSGRLNASTGEAALTNPQSFIAQLQHVVSAIQAQTPLLVDGHAGLRALALIERCYADRTLLTQPWLSPTEQSNARLWAATP